MKHLLKYNQYNFNEIENVKAALRKASDGGFINKDAIDDIAKYFTKPEIGSFEDFIISDFISHGDYNRMDSYLLEFEKKKIDTTLCKELKTKYDEFVTIENKMEEIENFGRNEERDVTEELDKLSNRSNKLYPYLKKYEDEINRIRIEARSLYNL
jgi:hypothetical protein